MERLTFSRGWRGLCNCLRALSTHEALSPHQEYLSSFSELYSLPPVVLQNLHKQGLSIPTDIQRKSLDSLLSGDCHGRCAVINAETGSGKTLCFLLPILKLFEDLWQRCGVIPAATAAILVPTSHLAQQISDVFRSLAHPNWHASVAAVSHSSFSFKKDSHLLIAIPTKIQDYSFDRLFSNNKILCLDEADVLLSGSESIVAKEIISTVRKRKETVSALPSEVDSLEYRPPSAILTAATLPSGGRQTAKSQIMRLFSKRSVTVFRTDNVHRTLSSAEMEFVTCPDQPCKFSRLVKDLDDLKEAEGEGRLPKVLVFVNTSESALAVSNFMLQPSFLQDGGEKLKWWFGKVGCFFSQPGVTHEERELVLKLFKQGSLRIIVCTDLGSRGLDFPDCSAVIQFDFPENSAFFLHRAGRTARAGRPGKVISYIAESDVDIAKEIQQVVTDRDKSFESVFSRNHMLRRKIKRRKQYELTQHNNEVDSKEL